MPISRTDRGPATGSSTSGTGQSATSGSFTPTNGRWLVITGGIHATELAVDFSVSDSFGSAVDAWTVIKSSVGVAYTTASCRAFVAYAYCSGTPGSGTVTVTRSGGTNCETFIGFTVVELSGVDVTTPVARSTTNQSTGGGSTLSTNLSGSPASDSYLIGAAIDFWGATTRPAALAALDDMDSYATSIVHRGDIATGEDTTPSGTTYSWSGFNGDATAAALAEFQVTQSTSDTAPAGNASATGTAYNATVSAAAAAAATNAAATGTANNATVTTMSNTPSPTAATAFGAAFTAKVHIDPTAGVASATGTANNATAAPHVRASAETAEAEALAFDTTGDSVEPPVVLIASDDDLLDLVVSQRREKFRFELLDAQHNVIGEVHPEVPVKISNDTSKAIMRRMSAFTIAPSEIDDVDVLADRVRPIMVLSNGSEYPLGIFLFADAPQPEWSFGSMLDGTLVDQGLILGQPLQTTISFPAETLVVDAMREVFARAGIHNAVLDASNATVGSAVAWPAGKSDTYKKVLDSLAEIAGFFPVYFDNDGVPRGRVAIDLDATTPSLVYANNQRIISGSIVRSNNALSAPNRYIVIDTSATINPVVAIYDLPASAPHSVARRGFAIPAFVEAPGIGNNDQALALAMQRAQTELLTFETVDFQSPTDPRHDTFDPITFLDDIYMEVAWSITCLPGGPMEHTINRQYLNE